MAYAKPWSDRVSKASLKSSWAKLLATEEPPNIRVGDKLSAFHFARLAMTAN
jgi:hypothetical protein